MWTSLPTRTSERGGEGDCVKEGGGGEEERERERALGLLLCRVGGGETMEDMCYERLRAEACVD